MEKEACFIIYKIIFKEFEALNGIDMIWFNFMGRSREGTTYRTPAPWKIRIGKRFPLEILVRPPPPLEKQLNSKVQLFLEGGLYGHSVKYVDDYKKNFVMTPPPSFTRRTFLGLPMYSMYFYCRHINGK